MSKLIGWIPVSERLPSKDDFGRTGFYLVTCYDDDGALMTKASSWGPVESFAGLSDTCKKYIYDGWAFGTEDSFGITGILYVDFVVAWTEMPDAYMGEVVSDIKAEDTISRNAAIDATAIKIKKWDVVNDEGCHIGLGLKYTDVIDMLTQLPSAQPEPCEDAVSRQAVINIINKPVIIKAKKQIEALPPVQSKRKTGHWINISISVKGESEAECDQCGCVVHNSFSNSLNYCPNCGAEMISYTGANIKEDQDECYEEINNG